MAKGKLRLSQPRKSKKLLMKKIALRRWKAVAGLEAAKKDGSTIIRQSVEQSNITNNIEIIQNGADGVSAYESVFDISEMDSNENHFSDTDDEYVYNEPGYIGNSSESNGATSESDFEELSYERDEVKSSSFNISGRRIINISYFFSQLKSLKHKGYDCSFFDLDLVSEKMEGLQSIFSFKCAVCNTIQTIKSEDPNDNINSNLLVVLGSISSGIGYYQLSEVLATLDVPTISHKTYNKYHDKVSSIVHVTSDELMIAAGKEEAILAKSSGDVNSDGVPVISVIVDGAWSKRSYRTNYNALSGVGCIIGVKTKKLLYVGVRNKYCYVCARSNNSATNHDCFNNWSKSSTAMEADIIVEGFKKSLEVHNLIYGRVIGDGDSSVYKQLTAAAPYGPTFIIEKIECRNHLLRNYLNKLSEISKNSNFPVLLRKKLTNSDTLGRFRNAVTKAIEHRKNESGSFFVKANLLKRDILNGPKHIFGDHSACESYFCKNKEEENLVPDLQICGLYDEVKSVNMRLANNAGSLLHDVDTNSAESYNSIVAKFVGGKRINFSLKGAYQTRCMAAAVSYNTYGDFVGTILKKVCEGALGIHCQKYQVMRCKGRESRRKGKSGKKKTFAATDEFYGPSASNNVPDMEDDVFMVKREEFLHNLKLADKQVIFDSTVLQSNCDVWKSERKKRITASSFGKICKLRKTTSTAKTVCSLLYSTFTGSNATRFGLDNEETAISLFQQKTGKVVRKSGLVIDDNYPYLACSPDGLIDDNAIIEIKSSTKSGNLSPNDAVLQKKIDYCSLENSRIMLKRNHNYFYQVQGLLHITQRDLCYFVVCTRGGLHIEEIFRDDTFWTKNMENRLCHFYLNCLLPELIDSRRCRQQDIRNVYLT